MHTFKVVLKGNHGVGKTTILAKIAKQEFDSNDAVDIQPDYKIMLTLDDKDYELEVLDVPDDYQMGDYFTKNGHGFLIIYSITDLESFQAVDSIRKKTINIKKSKRVPIVIVGNKQDLADSTRAVEESVGMQLVSTWPNCRFVEITATDFDQVQEAFKVLLKEILKTENTKNNVTSRYRCSIL